MCWTMFFSPRKKKFSPRKFSRFCPRKFASAREKILKTAREEKIVPVKNLANLHPRKKNLWARKKSQISPWKLQKIRENSLIYAREILTSTREKKSFCARENVRVPEKICAKVGEKNKFPREKTSKNSEKMPSRALFIFSGKKKTLLKYIYLY